MELDDRSDEVRATPEKTLTALAPSIASQGYDVERLVGIQLGQDRDVRAAILRTPSSPPDDPAPQPDAWLGLSRCGASGLELMAKPIPLGTPSSVVLWGSETVTLPSGTAATSITLALGGMGLEFTAFAVLVGREGPDLPVVEPKGAPVGQLASFGNVAQQFLITGGDEGENYARSDMLPGTGYYPRDGKPTFLSLALEQGIARGHVLGWLDRGAAKNVSGSSDEESWAIVGKGAWPAFCDDEKLAKKVRCSRLEGKREHTLSRDWIAGLWPTAEAAEAALKDLGADPKKLEYLAMDADESDVPKGPNGKKALTALKEEAAKKKPASPKR